MTWNYGPVLTDEDINRIDTYNEREMRRASAKLRDSVREAIGLHPFNRPRPIRHTPVRLVDLKDYEAGTWMGVVDSVARYCGVPSESLTSSNENGSRLRHHVRARALVMLILRNRGVSYPRIGTWLGGRDHSTVIHSVKRLEATITADEQRLVDALSPVVVEGDDDAS